MNERILVASDGTAGSLGALRMAYALQARGGGEVSVVTAVEPPTGPDVGLVTKDAAEEMRQEALRSRTREVQEQLASVGTLEDASLAWPLEVEVGSAAGVIARAAEDLAATLVVMGIGRRRPTDRFLGTGVPTAVAQLSPVSVLAVEPGRRHLPARVLVAVDFSRFSRRIVRRIPLLAADGAEIHLLHVLALPQETRTEWLHLYRKKAGALLDSLAAELGSVGLNEVTTRILSGDTATALLGFARDRGIELMATGTHGHSFVNRVLLGTVSAKLLRAAECAVLVVPPARSPGA